jgi:hypothetical protein
MQTWFAADELRMGPRRTSNQCPNDLQSCALAVEAIKPLLTVKIGVGTVVSPIQSNIKARWS